MLNYNKLYQIECQAAENFFYGSTKLQQNIFEFIFKSICDNPVAYFSQINAAKKLGCTPGYFNEQAHEFAKYGFFRVANRGANKTCLYELGWRLQKKEVLEYLSKIFPFLFKYKIFLLLSEKFLPEYEKLGKEDIFLINININKKYNKMSKKLDDIIYLRKLTRKRKRNFVNITCFENDSFNKDLFYKENNGALPPPPVPAKSFFNFSLKNNENSCIQEAEEDIFELLNRVKNQSLANIETEKTQKGGSLSWFMKRNRNEVRNIRRPNPTRPRSAWK